MTFFRNIDHFTNIQQMYCNAACFTEISDEKSMRTITANKGLWTNFCPPFLIFIKFWMVSLKKSNVNKTVYLLTENVYHYDLRLLIIFRKLVFFFFKTYLNGIISSSVQNNVNVIFTSYFAFTYVLVHIMILSKVLKHVIYLNNPPDWL